MELVGLLVTWLVTCLQLLVVGTSLVEGLTSPSPNELSSITTTRPLASDTTTTTTSRITTKTTTDTITTDTTIKDALKDIQKRGNPSEELIKLRRYLAMLPSINGNDKVSGLDFCLEANSPSVIFDENMITVGGEVRFPPPFDIGQLPEPSCLTIQLKDLTFHYTSSNLVHSVEIDVSEQKVNNTIPYTFRARRPIAAHLNRTYSVTAILNTGWCHRKGSNEWIRNGDLLSVKRHIIPLNNKHDVYYQDISLYCYGCERERPYGRYAVPAHMVAKSPIAALIPVTELSYDIISISGEIVFPKELRHLPPTSCVVVKLKDISYQDASSNVLASNTFSVTGRNVRSIKYSLTSKKPTKDNLDHVTVVTAVVNVGWCKQENSEEWLKEGDFLSVMRHRVFLTEEEDTYKRDIDVVCYFCIERRAIIDEEPPPTDAIPMEPTDISEVLATEDIPIPEDDDENANETMDEQAIQGLKISGDVILPRAMGSLPTSSCLLVKVKDVSMMDGSSHVIATSLIDVSQKDVERKIQYTLESDKPVQEYLNRMFALSAVLNMGWCKSNKTNEWIRSGDYLSVKRHHVIFNKKQREYNMDINIECYDDCADDEKDITPTDYPIAVTKEMDDTTPVPIEEEPEVYDLDFIKVKMGNGTISIMGTVKFTSPSLILPSSSCLTINLRDVTLQDIPSVPISTTKIDASELNISDGILFKVTSPKPIDAHLNRRFALNAVVNVGWCPRKKGGEWLKKGDYLSVETNRLRMKDDKDDYEKDIVVQCYECEGEKVEKHPNATDIDNTMMQDDISELLSFVPTTMSEDIEVTIDGELIFPDEVGMIPQESCLMIRLKDATRSDAFSDILSSTSINLGGRYIGKTTEYTFTTPKPLSKFFPRLFSLSAVVNIGWCGKYSASGEWIREGDYLTTSPNHIMFEENRDIYGQNFNLVCYDCGEEYSSIVRKYIILLCYSFL
jgi:uncharacterized lipoprotein YbaY